MQIQYDETRQKVLASSGHLLVLGGPGSGKTTIALLKANALAEALEPGQAVLFLSFSRAAVRQVLKGCEEHFHADNRRMIEVRTYHAFCIDVLMSFGKLLNGRDVGILYPHEERMAEAQFAGVWKIESERLAIDESRFCFDRFAAGVATLFEQSQSVLRLFGDRYPTVIVDEFQDTDDSQWRVVRALARVANLFCLADVDQRIFDYRPEVDPNRVETLRREFAPLELDLGRVNYRSPTSDILSYADAVLRNEPIKDVNDIRIVKYWPNQFAEIVHAATLWLRAELARSSDGETSVAVLSRTNKLVARISSFLSEEHSYGGRRIPPLPHDVLWDAELSMAAGLVVASILEWSAGGSDDRCVCVTLDHVAHFFELKGATGSIGAYKIAKNYRGDALKIREKKGVRRRSTKQIRSIFGTVQHTFVGEPTADWRNAMKVLESTAGMEDVVQSARMVRQFRASDSLSSDLAELWLRSGHYEGAVGIVEQQLSNEQVAALEHDHRGCIVMTMHKSKGKEFDGVILVEGSYAGRFFPDNERPPHLRSRRLLRVALTRAKRKVIILRPHSADVELTPTHLPSQLSGPR